MKQRSLYAIIFLLLTQPVFAQKRHSGDKKLVKTDSIAPVGIVRNISDSVLLDIVQRQTFRFFWHYAHPVSGLARERDNTVKQYTIGIISMKPIMSPI